jgi:drug/metabolite transporter (DMT)-like permease
MTDQSAASRLWARSGGLVLVIMTLLGWSSVPLFIKHFSGSIDVWTSNGWRYGFSALLWAPVLLWGRWNGTLPAGLWRAALVPSIFNALGQVAFAWAHYQIDPALLTFGLRVQIVFVAIGAALLFPAERRIIRSPGFLAGLALVFGGTMATVTLDQGFGQKATALGISLAISSGVFFASYGLSVRHFMHGFNPIQAFAAISQYTAAVMLTLMVLLADHGTWHGLTLPGLVPMMALSTGQIALLLLSSVIGIALGHVFYYASIARLGVAVSAGVIQLQPVIVGAASIVVFPNMPSLSGWQWITGCIAIAGAATILYVQHRMKPDPPPTDGVAPFDNLPVDMVAAAAVGHDTPVRR